MTWKERAGAEVREDLGFEMIAEQAGLQQSKIQGGQDAERQP